MQGADFLLLRIKLIAKLIVFPSGGHHLCLPVITCIVRACVLDWTLACCKYSQPHQLIDIVFSVIVLWGRKFHSFAFKQRQNIIPRDPGFGPSKVIEQKHFCFISSYRSILVIGRVFKYAITENKSERFQHKCFCTIIRSIYYEVSIFTSTMNQ